jgi:hypothetical protein
VRVIHDVDRTVQRLLESEFGTPLPFDLSLAVPDKQFTPVSASRPTLNCYLHDIHEDRELRQVAPTYRPTAEGSMERVYAPARIKVRYCITAWSPTVATPGTQPSLDEHALLGAVLAVLLKHPTLPAAVLVGTLAGQQPPLPASIVLPERAGDSWDFWNAVGGALRPSLDYAITFSLAFDTPETGPLVTTALLRVDGGDRIYTIGGVVRDVRAPERGVAGAWVRVDETGHTVLTDESGRFVLARLAGGAYTLRVRATAFGEGVRAITVPQPDGRYDVTLTPL